MANTNFRMIRRPAVASIQHKRVRSEVLKRLAKGLDQHIRRRKRLIAEWDDPADKPDFPTDVRISRTRITARIILDAPPAESAGISVYRMLDVGTRVRPMIMTLDFQAKTSPGVTTSRPGKGGPAYLDPADPAIGIKAREFDNTINSEMEKVMDKLIDGGYKAGLKKLKG